MANRFWGGLQNLIATGRVYNPYRNTYAPSNVRTLRTVSGVVGNVVPGPAGAVGGLVGGAIADRLPGAEQFDRQYAADRGTWPSWQAVREGAANYLQNGAAPTQPSYNAPTNGQVLASTGGIAGMLQAGRPQGGYTNFVPTGSVGAPERSTFTPDSRVQVSDVDVGPIGIDRRNMVINTGGASNAPRGQMGGGASGGTFTRGGTDASVLTGDAARDFYDSMRMGSMFGVRQTGGNIYGNRYEN